MIGLLDAIRIVPATPLLIAYPVVIAYVYARENRLPSRRLLGIVFVGGLFPDLVDKLLAHQLLLIPDGRVFMHSLPTALPFLFVVGLYGWQTDCLRASGVFIFAHLTHIVSDVLPKLIENQGVPDRVIELLFWPLTAPIDGVQTAYWAGPNDLYLNLWTAFSVGVLAISLYFLLVDISAQLADQ